MTSENERTIPTLNIVASKRLFYPVKFPFAAYSHKHDLLAVVAGATEVQVFRIISGQVAFTIKRSDAGNEVSSLAWKADGTCLGVGWSDGHYGIYDGGSGRQMSLTELEAAGEEKTFALDLTIPGYEYKTGDPIRDKALDKPKEPLPKKVLSTVACMGFMGHPVGPRDNTVYTKTQHGRVTTDDWYDGLDEDPEEQFEPEKRSPTSDNSLADFPRAIAALDVTKVLPRLSAVTTHGLSQPRSGPGASLFGSQAATDIQFETQRGASPDTVESLLVCQKDNTAQVLVDETVKIGTCKFTGTPIMHVAHPQSSTHVLLSEVEQSEKPLRVTFIDLPLQSLGGPLLHVVATNTKRIQTLLDYVVQAARCITFDYMTNVTVPAKYVQRLEDEMTEKHPADGDAVTNLYHLALTSTLHPGVRQWIAEYLKDASWRRWEQFLSTMYTNLEFHLFVNLLPALDRFSIAVTTLRGQAIFHEGTSKFDCPPQLFNNILENIDSLRLLVQKMQLITMTEQRQTKAFMKWMKLQIEMHTAEPYSRNASDLEERENPNIDYPLVLSFIKNTMKQSKLAQHIDLRPGIELGDTCSQDVFFSKPSIRDLSYERSKEALKQLDEKKSFDSVKIKDVEDPIASLNLTALTCSLVGRVHVALERITEWQNRMLFPPFDPPSVQLPEFEPGTSIVDMFCTPNDPAKAVQEGCSTRLIGLHSEAPDQIRIVELSPPSTLELPGAYVTPTVERTGAVFPGSILDAKFVPYTTSTFLTLFRSEDGDSVQVLRHGIVHRDSEENELESEILHEFIPDNNFRPEKILLGGRKGKVLCVVFGNRGREWRVLDLDAGVQQQVVGGDEEALVDGDGAMDFA